MNPLTQVKQTQSAAVLLGLGEDESWHARLKDSAYIFVGGIPCDLTEGDLLTVFAQSGEVVDVNLVRDKGTGKSKGFAFLAYEDERSTILAVDNLNGAKVLGRIIRVDNVSKYKKKEEEDEGELQKKKEEHGVCYAFPSTSPKTPTLSLPINSSTSLCTPTMSSSQPFRLKNIFMLLLLFTYL